MKFVYDKQVTAPMNFTQLRAFHAVAQTGSFSQAAQHLGVSQPAVTVQIKGLEEALGALLFLRGGARVELTAEGRHLLALVPRVLHLLEEIQHSVAATRALMRGQLRVGVSTPATILGLLALYSSRYPGIDLVLQDGNTNELMDDLDGNRVDVIVTSQLACRGQLFNLPLGRQDIVLVARPDHPLAERQKIEPHMLEKWPVLVREEGSVTRAVFMNAMRRAGIKPRIAASLGSREMVKEAAAAGLGLGVVFDGEVGRDDRLSMLRLKVDADLGTEVYLSCRPELAELGSVGALVRLAREEIADKA
jgi:aminoethylphosphonate catabolism LysR family transcriptional regulator